jgi:hypothetical protein
MLRYPVLLVVLVVAAAIAGCSSSTGPSGAETLDDYWIQGYYCHYPAGQRELSWEPCVVFVRSGGTDGDAVSGLSVTCNDQALTFQQVGYYADIADIEPGDDVTFRVSDGTRSVTLTLEVPGAPTNLALQEGSWDFSNPSGTHTLTWDNPTVVADSVLVGVVGQGVHPMMVFAHAEQLEGDATQVTLSNADMSDFSDADDISCAVTQGVRGAFPGHSGGSEMWARAGVIGDWSR